MAGVEHPLLTSLIRSTIARGERFYLTVSSDSMVPLLQTGDQVAVEAITPARLRPGDLVVLDENPGFLTHRYWGRSSEEKLMTRGDRTLTFDPPWEPERLLGRITARRRHGHTLSLCHGPGGWLAAHLGRVAAMERRLLAGATFPGAPSCPGMKEPRGRSLRGWLLRRTFQAWRGTITFPFTLIAQTGTNSKHDYR